MTPAVLTHIHSTKLADVLCIFDTTLDVYCSLIVGGMKELTLVESFTSCCRSTQIEVAVAIPASSKSTNLRPPARRARRDVHSDNNGIQIGSDGH